MKKIKIFSQLSMLFYGSVLMAQVGVGTNLIPANTALIIDGASDNTSVTPTSAQSANDVVVTTSGQVGIKTVTPDASAALDIQSKNSGFMLPRLIESQKADFVLPANGLMIYNITAKCIQYNVGTPILPNFVCVDKAYPEEKTTYARAQYTRNDFHAELGTPIRSEINFDNLLTLYHNGARVEGNLALQSYNAIDRPNVLLYGFQTATSNNKEGGGAVITIPSSAYPDTNYLGSAADRRTYRGGASGGEFINYVMVDPTGIAYRFFITLLVQSYTDYQDAGTENIIVGYDNTFPTAASQYKDKRKGTGRYIVVAEKLN